MDQNRSRKPELLAPASSLEVLKTAVIFGADAVYIGGEAFGLRAKARNFSLEDMAEGIRFAHERGVRVYVTANILAHNKDLNAVRDYFEELKAVNHKFWRDFRKHVKAVKPDALIISDPGVFQIAGEVLPQTERHISTQANNTNYGTFLFWHKLGAKRVVSARELSLAEIRQIREHIPDRLEIETFVHGAMCMSGTMSAKQLPDRAGCESGGLYTSLPLEIRGCGGDPSGTVYAPGRDRQGDLSFSFQRSVYDRAYSGSVCGGD